MASEPRTRTFTIPDPSPDEECPVIPEGADRWEAQEVGRAWRQVLRNAEEVMVRVQSAAATPASTNLANDAQALALMHAARAELVARIQAVDHRLRAEARAVEGRAVVDPDDLRLVLAHADAPFPAKVEAARERLSTEARRG